MFLCVNGGRDQCVSVAASEGTPFRRSGKTQNLHRFYSMARWERHAHGDQMKEKKAKLKMSVMYIPFFAAWLHFQIKKEKYVGV